MYKSNKPCQLFQIQWPLLTRLSRDPVPSSSSVLGVHGSPRTLNTTTMFARAIARSSLRRSLVSSKRSFHPLAGQSIQSIQDQWQTPPSANLVPIVIEQTVRCFVVYSILTLNRLLTQGRGERSYDIFSRLLRERVIMLHGPVSLY